VIHNKYGLTTGAAVKYVSDSQTLTLAKPGRKCEYRLPVVSRVITRGADHEGSRVDHLKICRSGYPTF